MSNYTLCAQLGRFSKILNKSPGANISKTNAVKYNSLPGADKTKYFINNHNKEQNTLHKDNILCIKFK